MKFVADVHVTKRIITSLRAAGHEVEAIAEINRRLFDRTILRYGLEQSALVLTFDNDYRYHILTEKQPTLGVVLVRLGRLRGEAETERVVQVIADYGERLHDHLTVIYPDRVEQYPL
jgi:predicted nuclease of predicted toxin-antitoxin system